MEQRPQSEIARVLSTPIGRRNVLIGAGLGFAALAAGFWLETRPNTSPIPLSSESLATLTESQLHRLTNFFE